MRYLSVCSGIEAATVAWHDLGWSPVAFSEIEAFPGAVLRAHYPDVPNWGNMLKFQEWSDADVDLLVGGTPCQSFSVAGLRKGLADPRGNLALTYLAIADKYRPRWLVWENVPGVLSSAGGRDFGAFLGGLGELGYGWAYRVLDAQYFGVAQRRRRVFVVASTRGWQRAAAVLFEPASLSGHPAPRREAGEAAAPTIAGCANGGGANGPGRDVDSVESLIPQIANPLTARMQKGINTTCDEGQTMIALAAEAGMRQTNYVAYALNSHAGAADGDQTNRSHAGGGPVGLGVSEELAYSLRGGRTQSVGSGMAVRRLTPRECERLQGFPDDYTLITHRGKPAADGPRYKALGNSMAVPVMRWIGQRLQAVDGIKE